MSKLNIAHFICDLGPGGGQRSTIDLINATKDQFDNHLILLENIRDYEPEGIDVSYVCQNKKIYKKFNNLGDRILAKKLEKILKEKKIDLVISHMEVTAKVLQYINIKQIYYMRVDIIQELDMLREKSMHRFKRREKLYKKLFENKNLITISRDTEKNISKFIKPAKIETIYNAFDFEKIQKMSELQIDKKFDFDYILQIGSGFKRKGQDTLIKAFSKIRNKEINLVLVGTNPYPEIKNLIEKLSLEDRVVFIPFTTNPYPYIKNAKLLIMSSIREGLPRVIVESLVLKTPVVSTDCDTGPREVLVDELSNYLSPVNDYILLANNIDNALEFYPEITDQYTNKFDKKNIIDKYLKYIDSIF